MILERTARKHGVLFILPGRDRCAGRRYASPRSPLGRCRCVLGAVLLRAVRSKSALHETEDADARATQYDCTNETACRISRMKQGSMPPYLSPCPLIYLGAPAGVLSLGYSGDGCDSASALPSLHTRVRREKYPGTLLPIATFAS